MATITQLEIPDDLYARLVERAMINRRAIEAEVLEGARQLVDRPFANLTKEQMLAWTDNLRARTPNTNLTDEFIRAARDEGRM